MQPGVSGPARLRCSFGIMTMEPFQSVLLRGGVALGGLACLGYTVQALREKSADTLYFTFSRAEHPLLYWFSVGVRILCAILGMAAAAFNVGGLRL